MAERLFTDLTATLLRQGHGVRFRAEGGSMHPTIRDGEVIAVEFVEPRDVKRGDILLYRNVKRVLAHRVVAILNPRSSILDPPSSILYPQSSIFSRSSILDPHPSVLSTRLSCVAMLQAPAMRRWSQGMFWAGWFPWSAMAAKLP